jgi:hypothetical protein
MSAPAGEPAAEQPADASRSRLGHTVIEVLAVIGPTSLLTGILYYFGYVSTSAYYFYFGVSLSALDYSTANYLVNSADTLFKPAATLLILLIAGFGVHALLGQALSLLGRHLARYVALSLCGAGAGLAVVGLLGLYGDLDGLTASLSLAASGLLLEYGVWTATQFAALPPRIGALIGSGAQLRRGLIAALAMVALFWAVDDLATARGTANARLFEQSLLLQPQAVVYSKDDLHLPGPGIGVTLLAGKSTAYHFRYNGLRQLLYTHDRWFLLPVGWTHQNGSTVIVLPDDPGRTRVDLAPSTTGDR